MSNSFITVPSAHAGVSAAVFDRLSGAPLDAMKTVAAVSMVLESANFILFENRYDLLWYMDRWTFPVFCFALAFHIARGFDVRGQAVSLLVLGALTQPVFAAAFIEFDGVNIFITLAIGAAIASAFLHRPVWQADLALAVIFGASLLLSANMFRGWEYGLPGAFLPLAMVLALRHGGLRVLWPAAMIAAIYTGHDLGKPALPATLFALIGGITIMAGALLLQGRSRFMPRYALHIVYPGHLAALVTIRALVQGG